MPKAIFPVLIIIAPQRLVPILTVKKACVKHIEFIYVRPDEPATVLLAGRRVCLQSSQNDVAQNFSTSHPHITAQVRIE